MPAYEEKVPDKLRLLLLFACVFFLLYSPFQLGNREFYWEECDYAVMAQETSLLLPSPVAHGEMLPNVFPLFPWLAAIVWKTTGLPLEFVLRAVSVASLALLAFLTWQAGRRAADMQAACVAVAVVISTNLSIEKTLDGYPVMTGIIFLFSGWLTWFMYGAERGDWNKAWLAGSFFCGLAFYTIGWEAIIYFFFPLIFMRRPLTIWTKLKRFGFPAGVLLIVLFAMLWLCPRWFAGPETYLKSFAFDRDIFDGYLGHLIGFPFDLLVRYAPWVLIAWAPFCVAYQPLDKNPIFSRFLRTIFISLFFLLWLSPFTKARDMLVLAPSLALLCGFNYWLVVRRNGRELKKFLGLFAYAALASGVFILAFYFLPLEIWQNLVSLSKNISFRTSPANMALGLAYASLSVLLGLWMIIRRRDMPIWEQILLTMVCGGFFFWTIIHPYKSQERSKTEFGTAIRKALGGEFSPDMTIHKDIKIAGLYGECHYIGCKIRKLHSFEELPPSEKTVLILSTEVPVYPERFWTNLLPESMTYKDKRIYLWKGVKAEKNEEK